MFKAGDTFCFFSLSHLIQPKRKERKLNLLLPKKWVRGGGKKDGIDYIFSIKETAASPTLIVKNRWLDSWMEHFIIVWLWSVCGDFMNFSSCWFKNYSRTLKLAYCYHYCDLSSKNYPIDNLQQYGVMWAL